MKKLLFLPLLVLLAIMPSCSNDDDGKGGVTPPVIKDYVCGIGEGTSFEFTPFTDWKLVSDAEWCLLSLDSLNFSKSIDGKAGANKVYVKVEDTAVEGDIAELTMTMGEDSYVVVCVHPAVKSISYVGELSVFATGSEDSFPCENVVCKVALNDTKSALDLYINGAKFAPNMPLFVDIRVDSIPCSVKDDIISFSKVGNIVPFVKMMGSYVPMDAYTFYNITGEAASDKLLINAELTRGKIYYEGTSQK